MFGFLVGAALLAPTAFGQASDATQADQGNQILAFQTMAPVDGAFVGPTSPIRDVPGGGLPWIISSAAGELRDDGHLKVQVRGLVLARTDVVPEARRGINPAPTFHAIVSCQTLDAQGTPSTQSVRTVDQAATTTGDADIDTQISLPQPCLGPVVFVAGGNDLGNWFAVSGA
jgi:hypothetical protein